MLKHCHVIIFQEEGRTVNETRTFFDLSKTTSSNVDEVKITVSGGGGGLILDLTPVFEVILFKNQMVARLF